MEEYGYVISYRTITDRGTLIGHAHDASNIVDTGVNAGIRKNDTRDDTVVSEPAEKP